jgi:NADP-dependent 3-hydroxy acid dehydrogenase YdfG
VPTPDPARITLVTGASSGIGEAVARRLAGDGHHVVAAARRADRLAELAAATADHPGTVHPAVVDVTDRAALTELVDETVAEHGRLDVVVNNAGVMPLSRLDALLVDEWDRMIDVNVRGLLHGIAATLPHFRRQGHGHVVTVASVGAHQVSPTAAVYCATKYAAWAITEGLRLEAPPGIRVTTVSPGVVDTELAGSITDPVGRDVMRAYRAHSIPPGAVADAVAYAVGQPDGVDVNEIVVRPVQQR